MEKSIPGWHPCFSPMAHFSVPRLHLPVARFCNIRCRYCSPWPDKSLPGGPRGRPGVASRAISVEEALEIARVYLESSPESVIGVAGPGDPLANLETFELFEAIKAEFPEARLCLCTNGLELPRHVGGLVEIGISALTVTVNAVRPEIGAKIYEWVAPLDGPVLRGEEAAELLWERQREGMRLAAEAGIPVKVNTVLIPGINDDHVVEVAKAVRAVGAILMNITPLIPAFDLSDVPRPSGREVREAREACEPIIPQFRLCKQCRSDACGIPGRGDITCFSLIPGGGASCGVR